jgi:hypothetical protein
MHLTSEMLVYFYETTWHYISEGYNFDTCQVVLGGLVVRVLAIGPKISGFKSG